MTYKVLIAINHPKVNHQWWSDHKPLPSFASARRHRVEVAKRWDDCDTAILAPDGRVLAFQDSLKEQADLEALAHG